MDAGMVDRGRERVRHVNNVGCERKRIVKKKKQIHRKVRRPELSVSKTLHQLFHSCKETFKGPGTVPSPQDVQKLRHILDSMKPEDVGLSRDLQFFKAGNIVKENQRVTYTTMHKCDNFSLCMFFIPEGGVIPLHNHPGMTVFSKLLLGLMHIKSYDWADPETSDHNLLQPAAQVRLAKLKTDKVFTSSCDTSVLYPTTGGNIHEFKAITPCVVLDVIGPPYSKEDGRDCSYYKDHPYASFPDERNGKAKEKNDNEENNEKNNDKDSFAWLEEIEMPENSEMDGIEYLGPRPF